MRHEAIRKVGACATPAVERQVVMLTCRQRSTLLQKLARRGQLGLVLVLTCACAGNVPPQATILFKGEVIPIRPVPTSVSQGASWVVKAFAQGDSVVRGYVAADEQARRELATLRGIRFEGRDKWSAVMVDWAGLHVLSHEGYVLLSGLPAVTRAEPMVPDDIIASMVRAGGVDISCTVRFAIDAGGNVLAARMSVSSGYEGFDRAALEAIRKFQYGPASQVGRPVPLETDVRFDLSVLP